MLGLARNPYARRKSAIAMAALSRRAGRTKDTDGFDYAAGLLPPDVRARSIAPAPPGFDARFSALWRRYCYRVCDDPAAADPLRRGDTLWHRGHLDLDRMNEAAAGLAGEHDFAAFRYAGFFQHVVQPDAFINRFHAVAGGPCAPQTGP